MIYPPSDTRPSDVRPVSAPKPGGKMPTERSPSTIVSFKNVAPEGIRTVEDIERRGALNPVKVKFRGGFNTALRHLRVGEVPLAGVARAERTDTFLAGYDAARILWANNGRPETSNEVEQAINDAFAIYMNTHHGANLSWDALRAERG